MPFAMWRTTAAGSGVAAGRPVAVLIPRVVVLERDVGIAGWTVVFQILLLRVAAAHELLDAPAVDGLTREQVAFGIEGDRVQEDEVPCHVPGTAEPGEDVVRPAAAFDRRAGRRLIE